MAADSQAAERRIRRFDICRRQLRLASGLTLFVYVALHLLNHALGLISIAAAEAGLRIAVFVWQSRPGTLMLYGAAGVHVSLALLALFEHPTLRLPPIELLRIGLGFSMPTLLIGHAVATRLAFEMFGHPPDYAHVVWTLWHTGRQGWQMALLVPGWMHGCLGLRLAIGRQGWYLRIRPVLFALALLLPACAVLGFLSMLREVALLARDAAWVAKTGPMPGDAQALSLINVRDRLLATYAAIVLAVIMARWARALLASRHRRHRDDCHAPSPTDAALGASKGPRP